jgi:hypothetical protein
MVPVQTSGINPYLYNTAGSTFTAQRQGGTILGLSTATTIITKAIQYKDINASDLTITTLPKALTGSRTYNTAKILSGGTFAYNAAKNNTWVLTRVTTTLAGVSKTFLQFMGNVGSVASIAYFVRDNYVNTTSLIRTTQFSRTGYSTTGTGFNGKIKARTPWITSPSGTAGTDFGTSTSLPSRAYPGELYILTNFIDYKPSTSSNKYYYKPITGM